MRDHLKSNIELTEPGDVLHETVDGYLRRALLANVYDLAVETPLERAPLLSNRIGSEVFLKREDQQIVFSFKVRGAYNKMASLSAGRLSRGVITASAGNHAQGVALSAKKLNCKALIVMPRTTPSIKVDAVQALGGEVRLFGDNYDEASAHARELAEELGLSFVHPYDDPDVIAGQGTIGVEILRQHSGRLDAIFIPVGGGGLIAGVGAVVKALRPEIKIIAVEPMDAAGMSESIRHGSRVTLSYVGRFADGVAVRLVGEETFRIARQVVDECVLVSNDEICGAIKDVFEDRRAVLEPAGALAYAGLKKWSLTNRGGVLVAIASGANINFDSLRHVSERAEVGERREIVLGVTIPERPGSFREFCQTIGNRNITEFNYRFAGPDAAHVFVGIRIDDQADVITELQCHGYEVLDLTDDETAKLHVRHMVGGRAMVAHERIISFEFPERSGALMQFLSSMDHPWNISLFHYRNHGSDIGRVLVGIEVDPTDIDRFAAFLEKLGYDYADVSSDPACAMFL